ncbi:MAG TPA: YfcE family phosphodiesterase [Anaerolineae bacterium]|nr:YfcE family phosphodiesterase [Anaerolineae bacterium]
MKIGLLSDIHNNRDNLIAALKVFEREGIQLVICGGDVVDADLIPLFAGLELHLVEGNIDHDPRALRRAIERLGSASTFGLEYTATIEGKQLAMLHGHLVDRLIETIHSGLYDYVIHGHTHRRRDERIGRTRVINPGALGGKREQTHSCAILNPATDTLRVIEIGD